MILTFLSKCLKKQREIHPIIMTKDWILTATRTMSFHSKNSKIAGKISRVSSIEFILKQRLLLTLAKANKMSSKLASQIKSPVSCLRVTRRISFHLRYVATRNVSVRGPFNSELSSGHYFVSLGLKLVSSV